MEQNQLYVCLSNKEFNRDQNYDFLPMESGKKSAFIGKPFGMWFSKACPAPYLCEWQKFLTENASELVTMCCNEQGKTNAIFATLKNSLIIRPEEIKDEIAVILSECDEDTPIEETRKRLLDLVREKKNRKDIDYLICNLDATDDYHGGFGYIYPYVVTKEDMEKMLQSHKSEELMSNIFELFSQATGLGVRESFKQFPRDVLLEELDLIENINSNKSFDNEEYIEMFKKFINKDMLVKALFRVGPHSREFHNYIENNYIIKDEKGYCYNIEGILNDVEIGQPLQIYFKEYFFKMLKFESGIDEKIFEVYRHAINQSNTWEEMIDNVYQEIPNQENPDFIAYKRVLRLFSGTSNEEYTRDCFDIPSLCIFDTNCIEVKNQFWDKIFTTDLYEKAVLYHKKLSDKMKEYEK